MDCPDCGLPYAWHCDDCASCLTDPCVEGCPHYQPVDR
jgi:hypothetical protein